MVTKRDFIIKKLANFKEFIAKMFESSASKGSPLRANFDALASATPEAFSAAINTTVTPFRKELGAFIKTQFIQHGLKIADYKPDDLVRLEAYLDMFCELCSDD